MAFNIADLVEHTVDAVPDRTALICGDRRITFAELEERANRLAHHLAAHGVGARRPRGDLLVQQHRVRRDDARGLQAARRPDQRELPLRRGRAAPTSSTTPTRRRSSSSAQFSPTVAAVRPRLPQLRHFVVIDDGTGADLAGRSAGPYERGPRRGVARARLRPRVRRRPLHPLHRRHDRDARRASCGATRT